MSLKSFRQRKWLLHAIFVFGAALCFVSFIMFWSVEKRSDMQVIHNNEVETALKTQETVESILATLFDESGSGSVHEEGQSIIADLPEDVRAFVQTIISAKQKESRFFTQERLLFHARLLLEANENDPIAAEYLKESDVLNSLNLATVGLNEIPGDCEWNARLYYLQGAIFYRALAFQEEGDQSTSLDLIDQAIRSFERIFECFPKDHDAEVAIEKLYEVQKKQEGGSGQSAADRLQVLPQPGRIGEDGPGTGGDDREDGRH